MSIENPRRSPRVSAVVYLIQGLAVLSVLAGLAVTVMRGGIVLGGPEFDLVRKAWAPPNWVYVAGGLGLLALAAAPIHPAVGLWVYIALACGFPRYRPEHEFLLRSGLLEWVSALSVLGWIGWMIRHGRRPSLPRDLLPWLLAGLVAWVGVCTVASYLGDRSWTSSVKYHPVGFLSALVMFLVARDFLGDLRQCCLLAMTLVVSLSVRAVMFPQLLRHDNDISALIAVALPLAFQATTIVRTRIAKVIFAASAAYLLWVLYETANRGAAIGLVAAVLALWLQSRRKLLMLGMALPAILCGGVLFVRTHYWQRFADIWQGGPGIQSVLGRLEIWRSAWKMFLDHPLMGVGPGNFSARVGSYAPALTGINPHNNFMAMLTETGALGLALYVAFFLAAIISLWRLGRSSRESWPGGAARFYVGALVAYLVTGCFINRQAMVLAYALAGASVALRRITPAETARPGPAGPVPFEHDSAAPKRNHQGTPAGSSRAYLVLLLCYLVFVVYGSLVPLKFHYVPLNVAWRQFLGIRYLSLGIASRADLVSNLLLLVPLTFFAMGTFARRDEPVSRWFVIAAIAAAAGALAVAIEFTQIYFPQRTVSLNDILAETAGAVVGIACWFLWGSLITDWARGLWQSRDEDRRAIRILCGYLVFLVLYQLLPFDATIRTVELYHRIKQGRVILLPFSDIHTFSLYAVMSKIAVMVPVGFLFCMVNRRHSVFRATVFGVMFAAGIEFLQIFIFSRVASSTDAVIGSLGAWMGAWLAVTVGPVSRKPLTQSPVWMRHRHWIKWAATVGWIAIIAWYKWRPFDFAWPVEGLFTHIASVARVPLYFQYYQSEFMASAQVARLLTVSFVTGMLLKSLTPPRSRWLPAAIAIVAIALILEIGRLFLPHRIPDVIQALLFIAGGVAGIRCFGPFTRLFLARPQAAQRDPIRPDHSDDPLPGDRPGL